MNWINNLNQYWVWLLLAFSAGYGSKWVLIGEFHFLGSWGSVSSNLSVLSVILKTAGLGYSIVTVSCSK